MFADHFSAVAGGYAEFRPTYPAALIDVLADACGVAEPTAWDAGCGNGQLSAALATRFARVIATDPSQQQLAHAEPHPRVDYRRATAEAGIAETVELAVAAQAAHWFEWPAYVVAVARALAHGGVAALVSYGDIVIDGSAAVPRYQDLVRASWPPERRHVDDGYAQLRWPDAWMPIAAPALAMTATWTRAQLVGYLGTWSSTQAFARAHGNDPLDRWYEQLVREWPDAATTRPIRWPLTLKLARRTRSAA
jgi:SAM-dependent methyltransferase